MKKKIRNCSQRYGTNYRELGGFKTARIGVVFRAEIRPMILQHELLRPQYPLRVIPSPRLILSLMLLWDITHLVKRRATITAISRRRLLPRREHNAEPNCVNTTPFQQPATGHYGALDQYNSIQNSLSGTIPRSFTMPSNMPPNNPTNSHHICGHHWS